MPMRMPLYTRVHAPQLGDLVEHKGVHGRVAFTGLTLFSDEEGHVGIEFERRVSGGHDGCVGGIRYWEGKSGTCKFVRAKELRLPAPQHETLARAARAKLLRSNGLLKHTFLWTWHVHVRNEHGI